MTKRWKRYEFWASKDGKPFKCWTQWFEYDGDEDSDIQAKGYKGDHLLQEFKEE